ncbi:Periplasmic nitrate reductase [Labeo rohita]|uniref:Periplasmic nitrate reductase n=1 Tax=Labeo rohita TaxID=84645 RepID=A0ABQ8LCI3_LABRO|nr:Periplasmic nitrate reductase [Labeo rohita]
MKKLRFCVLLSAKPPHVCFSLFNILKALRSARHDMHKQIVTAADLIWCSRNHCKCFLCLSIFAEQVKKESAKGCTSSRGDGQQDEKPSQEVARNASKKAAPGSSTKNVFARLLKVAQHYLMESGKYSGAARSSPAKRSPALGRLPKTRISTSFTQAQGRSRRNSSRRSQNSTLGGVKKEQLPSQDSVGGVTEDSTTRISVGRMKSFRPRPVGKVARRRSRGQSGRGSSLLLKNLSSRSQQTAAQTRVRPESSKSGECQETQISYVSRPYLNPRAPGGHRPAISTCPLLWKELTQEQMSHSSYENKHLAF